MIKHIKNETFKYVMNPLKTLYSYKNSYRSV